MYFFANLVVQLILSLGIIVIGGAHGSVVLLRGILNTPC